MKKVSALGIIMALSIVGCSGVVPQTPPPSPGTSIIAPMEGETAKAEDGGLSMTVRVSAAAYRPGHPVVVTVTARNTGTEPVPWIGNSGCDNGLYGRVMTSQGEGWFQLRRDGPPMACTAVMIEGKLAPGAVIEDEYTWDQMVDGVPAPPGNHTVVAGFRRGLHFDQVNPVEVRAEIRLEGGESFIAREAAIKVATDLSESWVQAHTGNAVVKQVGGEWFVLMARSHDDPSGEWVKSGAEHAAEIAQQKPAVSAEFKDGGWEVRFATKLGPAPREQVVFVNGTSGVGIHVK